MFPLMVYNHSKKALLDVSCRFCEMEQDASVSRRVIILTSHNTNSHLAHLIGPKQHSAIYFFYYFVDFKPVDQMGS